MKAIVFAQTGGPEVLALSDVPTPEVRPGMVLIKVHAIGVNFADTRFRQGTYVVKPKLPDTPGMEAAGVVEAVGDGVTGPGRGQRVAAFTVKSYAEYCQAPASMVIPLPDTVSFVHGAAFPIQDFPDKTRESASHCFALMREGRLKLHIGRTFGLPEAADAHRHLESRQSTGKLVLIP